MTHSYVWHCRQTNLAWPIGRNNLSPSWASQQLGIPIFPQTNSYISATELYISTLLHLGPLSNLVSLCFHKRALHFCDITTHFRNTPMLGPSATWYFYVSTTKSYISAIEPYVSAIQPCIPEIESLCIFGHSATWYPPNGHSVCKRALYFHKRVLYFHNRTIHFRNTPSWAPQRLGILRIPILSAKEPYFPTKKSDISAIKPYISQ